ncbi:hypothetical protein [Haloferula sargassicola]|uniref:hypothetical protein n=1 Tax=Haloferula sargassicola TaxID=490096 RepID=UPI00336596A3
MQRFMEEEGGSIFNNPLGFVDAAKAGAIERGPEALADFFNSDFSRLERGGLPQVPHFPDSFDFQKLADLTRDKAQLDGAVVAWASRNPEAARDFVKSVDDPKLAANLLSPLLNGAAANLGDDMAAELAVGLIDGLSGQNRQHAIQQLRGQTRKSGHEVTAVLRQLPDPSDREIYAAAVVSIGTPPTTIDAVFSEFERPEDQTAILVRIAPGYRMAVKNGGDYGQRALDFFDGILNQLQLPTEARQQVLDSLHQRPPGP